MTFMLQELSDCIIETSNMNSDHERMMTIEYKCHRRAIVGRQHLAQGRTGAAKMMPRNSNHLIQNDMFFSFSLFFAIECVGDAASDCTTSYYSEYDPFDYLYSCGTQYSDPVYEAVNKIERTPISPNGPMSMQSHVAPPPIGWNVQSLQTASISSDSSGGLRAPPLPPRNVSRHGMSPEIRSSLDSSRPDAEIGADVDRRKIPAKLYENVIENRTYDAELMAFFDMVRTVRAQYKYTDQRTNVGHIVASEFNNHYPDGTEIKLIVHPLLRGGNSSKRVSSGSMASRHSSSSLGSANGDRSNSGSSIMSADETANRENEKGQFEGYGPPVVFTCDSE